MHVPASKNALTYIHEHTRIYGPTNKNVFLSL